MKSSVPVCVLTCVLQCIIRHFCRRLYRRRKMDSLDLEIAVKLIRSSVAVLVCLLLAGCSLIGSLKEDTQFPPSDPSQTENANVISEDNYMESCRAKGVPIPPDWKASSSEWERHGNLHTILLTPNNLDQT